MHGCMFIGDRSQKERIDRAKCRGPRHRVIGAAMAGSHRLGAWQKKIIFPDFWLLKAGTTALEGSHSSEAFLLGCPFLYCCFSVHKHPGVSANLSFPTQVQWDWTRCPRLPHFNSVTLQRSWLQSQSHSEVQGRGGHRGEARASTCIWKVTAELVTLESTQILDFFLRVTWLLMLAGPA